MTRTLRLLASTTAAVLFVVPASSALAGGGSHHGSKGHGGKKTTVKILSASQKDILKHGLRVKVKGSARKVKVTAKSNTFDSSHYSKLTKPKKVKLGRSGSKRVKLKLLKSGRKAVKSCEARSLRVNKGAKGGRDLIRDTSKCKPKKVDLSSSKTCDFIGDQDSSLCLLPFPDDYYTVKDKTTSTGRRINLRTAGMPKNEAGNPIDASPYNLNDGFSPGQSIVVKVPGLDTLGAMAKTGGVSLSKLSDYKSKKQPIVVIDTTTGKRWPIWAEIDSKSSTPKSAAVLIHPAKNFAAGHRYIVAMRNLKNAKGKVLSAPEGFRYYRDDLPTKKGAIKHQHNRFESIFTTLRKAKIDRSDLYLAWDFTVASDENIAGRLLKMRDESFAQLGDTNLTDLTVQGNSPAFTVTATTDYTFAQDPNMARKVEGTFAVPCYLAPNCAAATPGGRFNLDADGLPTQTGTYNANFTCMIPRSAVDAPASAARPSLYGHGLLGSAGEATSSPQRTLGNSYGFVFCATDELGLAQSDVPNAYAILQNMSNFPELADRLQQGLLDELFLGRLMIHPNGFVSNGAFHADGTTASAAVINTSRLYYNGNSQGGIEGGALTAVAPDFTRASLGVPGMNYSVLLNRSVDFDQYAELAFEPSYTNELEQPLVLSLIQMLWDRGEANGYAHRMTSDPLPNTPPHEVLMNVAFGDHQVSTFTADTEARTIGAQVHTPLVYDGRWPNYEQAFGIQPLPDPYQPNDPSVGSALIYWDSGPIRDDPSSADPAETLGTDPPPIENLPNRSGDDPHGLPRATPAEQKMVSDFLRPNAQSQISETCSGGPCYDFNFLGP